VEAGKQGPIVFRVTYVLSQLIEVQFLLKGQVSQKMQERKLEGQEL